MKKLYTTIITITVLLTLSFIQSVPDTWALHISGTVGSTLTAAPPELFRDTGTVGTWTDNPIFFHWTDADIPASSGTLSVNIVGDINGNLPWEDIELYDEDGDLFLTFNGSTDGGYDRQFTDSLILTVADLSEWALDNTISFMFLPGDGVRNIQEFSASVVYEPIPEPSTYLLLGSGLIGLAWFRRKFRKR